MVDGFYLHEEPVHFHCTPQALYVALALNFPEGLPVAKAASTVNLLL